MSDDEDMARDRAAPTRKWNYGNSRSEDDFDAMNSPRTDEENAEEFLKDITSKRFSITNLFKKKSKKETSENSSKEQGEETKKESKKETSEGSSKEQGKEMKKKSKKETSEDSSKEQGEETKKKTETDTNG